MPANIETMAWTGERPWHGLGTQVAGLMTAREAIVAAGLDWQVGVQPLFVEGGFNLDTGVANMEGVEGFSAVVRKSDHKALGVVGGRYVPVQNTEAFDFFDAIVQDNGAKYETVGALAGGRRVWMLAKLSQKIDLSGVSSRLNKDTIEPYVLLSNTHDGSGALRMFFTPVRVVCQNTESMALKGAGKDGISIRHTKSATERMKEAARVAEAAGNYFTNFGNAVKTLASTRFSMDNMKELAAELFPSKDDGGVATRTQNNRTTLLALFDSGHGNVGETAWDAYNAVTEFSDWNRSTRTQEGGASEQEQRFSSNIFGSGRIFKDKGLDAIKQITGIKLAA